MSSEHHLPNAWDSCFVPVPILTPRLRGRSEVLNAEERDGALGSGRVDWSGCIKAIARGCQNSSSFPPQLLPFYCFFYFTLAAKSQKEIKGGQHERHPWDSVFLYPVSLLSPLQIWKCWIPNTACTLTVKNARPHLTFSCSWFCFSSSPSRLTPSSSSLSILCSRLSPAALRLAGR